MCVCGWVCMRMCMCVCGREGGGYGFISFGGRMIGYFMDNNIVCSF